MTQVMIGNATKPMRFTMVFVSAGRRGYGCRARRSSRPRALRCSRTSCSECDRTARSYRGTGLTSCLEGRFRQGVNLRVPRSEAVLGARG